MLVGICGNSLFMRAQCVPQNDDAVEMIGHDDKRIDVGERELLGDAAPGILKHASGIVQMHLAIMNLPEERSPLPDTNRYEIRAGGGVVVRRQTN
ncbi:MAG TPA: hypothetical protein VH370_23555 [Humisphaera sp.]|nr:hypothetical protein [Humisphaera sp.]